MGLWYRLIKTVGQDIELMHKGFVQFNGCSWHKFLGFSEFIFANYLYPKCFLQCFCLTVNSPVSLPVLLHSGHSKNTVLPQKLELMWVVQLWVYQRLSALPFLFSLFLTSSVWNNTKHIFTMQAFIAWLRHVKHLHLLLI